MGQEILNLVLIPFIAVLPPLIAASIQRYLVIPIVVFEVALGMIAGLGLVTAGEVLVSLSQLGLAMLFFMAGIEIDVSVMGGETGRRSLRGWAVSALLAISVGLVFGNSLESIVIIAIALSGTALGTITPMLRDAGLTNGPLGRAIVGAGAIGEFAPLVAISVFLSGRQPLAGIISLFVYLGVAAFAFWLAKRGPNARIRKLIASTMHTSGQFAMRLVLLLLALLVALSAILDIDFLLGAFTAGLLARVVLMSGDKREEALIETKLEAISFGFLVPLFFVVTGVTFPLAALLDDPAALALVPVFAVVILVVRGLPGFFAPPKGASFSDRRTAALFIGTTLPLVIAVTQIGTANDLIDQSLAAALVGGALLTVMLFPMLALVGRKSDEVEPRIVEVESA